MNFGRTRTAQSICICVQRSRNIGVQATTGECQASSGEEKPIQWEWTGLGAQHSCPQPPLLASSIPLSGQLSFLQITEHQISWAALVGGAYIKPWTLDCHLTEEWQVKPRCVSLPCWSGTSLRMILTHFSPHLCSQAWGIGILWFLSLSLAYGWLLPSLPASNLLPLPLPPLPQSCKGLSWPPGY